MFQIKNVITYHGNGSTSLMEWWLISFPRPTVHVRKFSKWRNRDHRLFWPNRWLVVKIEPLTNPITYTFWHLKFHHFPWHEHINFPKHFKSTVLLVAHARKFVFMKFVFTKTNLLTKTITAWISFFIIFNEILNDSLGKPRKKISWIFLTFQVLRPLQTLYIKI